VVVVSVSCGSSIMTFSQEIIVNAVTAIAAPFRVRINFFLFIFIFFVQSSEKSSIVKAALENNIQKGKNRVFCIVSLFGSFESFLYIGGIKGVLLVILRFVMCYGFDNSAVAEKWVFPRGVVELFRFLNSYVDSFLEVQKKCVFHILGE
jgi:hypothetical protein